MVQLVNQSRFSAIGFKQKLHGGKLFDVVVCKATFRITQNGDTLPLIDQPGIVVDDVSEGEVGVTSLAYPSDLYPYKPGTDVLVVGAARAPGGRSSEAWLASIHVGPIDKQIKLLGPRTWSHRTLAGWRCSAPEAVDGVRLSYGNAFGGMINGGLSAADVCLDNPFGRGFFGSSSPDTDKRYVAPQIEAKDSDPFLQLGEPQKIVGLSPVDGRQHARLRLTGTFDDVWKKSKSSEIPVDFDYSYWQAAAPDQVVTDYLKGGEEVELIGLFPEAKFSFKLPSDYVRDIFTNTAGRLDTNQLDLDTVLIDLDKRRLTMRWHTMLHEDFGVVEHQLFATRK
jgi:hypothetical protein